MNGEEIYVTMVVLKRPTREGQPGLDPQQLAQALIQGLTDQGSVAAPRQFAPNRTRLQADTFARSRAPGGYFLRRSRRWIQFGLSFMLMAGAVYAFLHVLRSGK